MPSTHTKSRLGCQRCKLKKVKCDEGKPSCRRCIARREPCVYLVTTSSLPTAPQLSTHRCAGESILDRSPNVRAAHGSLDGASSVASPYSDTSTEPAAEAERFSLVHLELLDHLKSGMLGFSPTLHPEFHHLLQVVYSEAFCVPYLMDELLALAAAHKSTMVPKAVQRRYHGVSTELQNRAISQVTTRVGQGGMTQDNPIALFMFSALLGQHVLFDISASRASLPATLDKIVQCLDLHRVIRSTASQNWGALQPIMGRYAADTQTSGTTSSPDHDDGDHSGTDHADDAKECSMLMTRLRGAALEKDRLDVYCGAVDTLQHMFDSVRDRRDRLVVAVQDWLVRVSSDYISLLRQRRPESLVIFTHYAVLLHLARDHWVAGGSGRYLIEAITDHLGDYWSDWLAWPQHVLRES